MLNEKKSSNTMIMAICLAVIIIAGLVNVGVNTNGGDIEVKEVVISPYGADLTATIYIPKMALETDKAGNFINKLPAVICNHGSTNSRTFVDNVAIELSRAGFVVMSVDMYGHYMSEMSPIRDMSDTVLDALGYLRTLGFVDQTRIGATGHSAGGEAVGGLAVTTGGYYTLQDQLLIMLNEKFGVTVTREAVAAQDADALAESSLDDFKLGEYETLKAQIVSEYDLAVRDVLFIDGGFNLVPPKVVEVAGVPVWRDIQSNFGYIWYLGGNASKGWTNPDYHLSTPVTLQNFSSVDPVERETWYTLNLSGTEERAMSTKLTGFYDGVTSDVQKAADNNSLRIIFTPWGWHGITYFNVPTAKIAVDFFRDMFNYDNGVALNGSTWVVRDIFSGLGTIALFVLILSIVEALMKHSFFSSMKGAPMEPIQNKKSPLFWIFMFIVTIGPAFTYTAGVSWGAFISAGPLATQGISTRIAFWSIIMAVAILALTIIKYFIFDKKSGVSFAEMYGLKYSWKNIGKSFVLAFAVFVCVAVLLAAYYNFFTYGNLKITLIGVTVFSALSKMQYYSWLLYAIYILPFYFVNSMLLSSARVKGMSERANMWLFAGINCLGMLLLLITQFFFGLARQGATVLPIARGTSSYLYAIAVLMVCLFVSAIFTRKLYLKTGSAIPGAILNAAIFAIPLIHSSLSYTL